MTDFGKATLALMLARLNGVSDRFKAVDARIDGVFDGLRAFVDENKEALRGPAGKDADHDAVSQVVRSVVDEIKHELRGNDGQDAKPEQIEASVRAVVRELSPSLKGKDGKSVTAEQVETLVRAVFNEQKASLKGKDGKDVDMNQVNAMVKAHLKDVQPAVDAKALSAAVQAEVQKVAPTMRGNDGQPGLVWRGQWVKYREYQPGDVVRHRGSSWVAVVKVVGIVPGTSEKHWDLVAKAGQDGGGGGPQSAQIQPQPPLKVWTLADSQWPYFGYTDLSDWKIERIGLDGLVVVARKQANGQINYETAWSTRETLTFE